MKYLIFLLTVLRLFHIVVVLCVGHYLCDVYNPTARVWKSCDDSTVRDVMAIIAYITHIIVLLTRVYMQIEELEVRQKRSTTGYIFFYMHK